MNYDSERIQYSFLSFRFIKLQSDIGVYSSRQASSGIRENWKTNWYIQNHDLFTFLRTRERFGC